MVINLSLTCLVEKKSGMSLNEESWSHLSYMFCEKKKKKNEKRKKDMIDGKPVTV